MNPEAKYEKALEYINDGKAKDAYTLLYSIKNLKKARVLLNKFDVFWQKELHIDKHCTMSYEFIYDEAGNKIKKTYTDPCGGVMTTHYEYNANRQMTKKTEICGERTETEERFYDSNGKLTKEISSDSKKGIFYICEYILDENGNTIQESRYYGSNPSIDSVTTYVYNADKNILKTISTDSEGNVTETCECWYDENGRITKIAGTNEHGSFSTEKTWDKNGNITRENCINSDGSNSFSEFEYDKIGRLTRTSYTSYNKQAKHTHEINYIFDENGRLIRQTGNINGEEHITEYLYDKNGNEIENILISPEGTSTIKFSYDENGNRTRIHSSGDIRTEYSDFVYFYRPDKE